MIKQITIQIEADSIIIPSWLRLMELIKTENTIDFQYHLETIKDGN